MRADYPFGRSNRLLSKLVSGYSSIAGLCGIAGLCTSVIEASLLDPSNCRHGFGCTQILHRMESQPALEYRCPSRGRQLRALYAVGSQHGVNLMQGQLSCQHRSDHAVACLAPSTAGSV
jgi:hypothetical protein